MRTFTQLVLPVVIVVLIVGGVTFVSQYDSNPSKPSTPAKVATGTAVSGDVLTVPSRVAVVDPENPDYAAEHEIHTVGTHDFWVANGTGRPADIWLRSKSCTCTDVRVGVVPTAARDRWLARAAVAVLTRPEVLMSAALVDLIGQVDWNKVEASGGMVTVPAADRGPQLALIRLTFDTRELGAKRLTADIGAQRAAGADASSTQTVRFEVPISVVPPLLSVEPTGDVGVLSPGTSRSHEFLIWSATRTDLKPELKPLSDRPDDDECIQWSAPVRLSDLELQAFRQLRANDKDHPPTRPVAAYRVTVNVTERVGDKQLDLGPFTRKRRVATGLTPEQVLTITGSVRGPIRLLTGSGREHVVLGDFPARRGASETVTLIADRSDIVLEMSEVVPEAFQAMAKVMLETDKPTTDGRPQWRLTVDVPPDKAGGLLPAGSAVVLRTTETPPRRIRIPVTGNATR